MGFFQLMEQRYGTSSTRLLKRYNRGQSKLASLKNRRSFLLKCRKFGILPDHITHRVSTISQLFEFHDARTGHQVDSFYHRLVHKILSMEISITLKNLNYLSHQLTQLKQEIVTKFPEDIWLEFEHRCSLKFNREFHKVRSVQTKKFDRLLQQQTLKIKTSETWFKNISNTEFPTEVSNILALGPKFSLQPNYSDISIPRILAEVETINFDNIATNKHLTTAKITNILTNWIQKQPMTNGNIQRSFSKASKFIREHPDVIITQADKGNVTVAMNVEQYHQLSETILSDAQYYEQLSRDPTSTLQQRANKLISELKRDKMIELMQANKLTIYNARPAKFYGLPKIHKPTLSLRPIISSLQCPNSMIAKLVTNILTEAYNKNNDYYIRDSFEFSALINNFILPDNFVLVSLDVTSLFTNIPTQLVCQSIERRWDSIRTHTNITKDRFLHLVNFIFDSTYFTYNNKFFKQVFGTPMGSVLSPIVAQYVMDDFLNSCLPILPYKMPFIKKYVDDIICAIPMDAIDLTLNIFNSQHQKIQFTIERETNNAVPFLDTLVIRENNTIKTDWYIKPTASGRYINFHSFHTTKMKINTVLNMKNRVMKLSHPIYQLNNMKKLFDIMHKNSFPAALLNKLLYSTPVNDLKPRQPTIHPVVQQPEVGMTYYRTLPHVDVLSNRIISALSTIPNVKIALKNQKTVRSLYTPLKDRTPTLQQSHVVYSIPCSGCELVYIGQTARTLHARIVSHRSDIRNGKATCQLAIHSNHTNHQPKFEEAKVLDIENNLRKRTFLEMVRIAQTDNAMNSRKDIDGLSSIYTFLLQIDKENKKRPRGAPVETMDSAL